MRTLKDIAVEYFDAFERADLDFFKSAFSREVSLHDWNGHIRGFDFVIKEYQNLFDVLNSVVINVINLYQDESSVIAELVVHVNEIESMRVVDILSFNQDRKICAIAAYKQ
jgi:SnoaL-like domain